MAYKAIITLPGYDVATATPEQCSIHSDYPSPKMEEANCNVVTYTFTSEPATDVTLVTKAHGYSYKPAALVWVEAPAAYTINGVIAQFVLPWIPAGSIFDHFESTCDATNLYITYKLVDGGSLLNGATFKFKYYIFAETGL